MCLVLVACAKGGADTTTDGSQPPDGNTTFTPSSCPAGQLATDISPTGDVTCKTVDTSITSAITNQCAIHLGWRDECNGCALPPTKFGSIGKQCVTGTGAQNVCVTPTLGGKPTPLFGLNFDGDANDDDKLYGGLHCVPPVPATGITSCPADQFIVGAGTCASVGDVVIDYVRTSCALYLGWQDNCDGCATQPGKWGFAGDAGCTVGAGINNTCVTTTLGGEMVNLIGLNTDGDVNDDDKFHVGLDCRPPTPATTSATTCPAGQFVAATELDGTFRCESVAPLVADVIASRCTLTFGWHDNCDGCLTPPTKFGSVRVGACTLGGGLSNTCSSFTLGGRTVNMFGLNTDGDVNGDDTFYVGFRCE